MEINSVRKIVSDLNAPLEIEEDQYKKIVIFLTSQINEEQNNNEALDINIYHILKAAGQDNYTKEEQRKMEFILKVISLKKYGQRLNENQKEVCRSFINKINDNINKIKVEKEKRNNIVESIETEELFTGFDKLKEWFDEEGIALKDQLKIISDIALKNYSVSNMKQNNIDNRNYNRGSNKEIIHNSEEDLIRVFAKFGFDYSEFEDGNKEILIHQTTIQKIEEILDSLREQEIDSHRIFKRDQELFTIILKKSSKETIEEVVKTCEDNDIKINFVNFAQCLFPPSKNGSNNARLKKGSDISAPYTGQSTNLIQNIRFLKEKGFNVSRAFRKNSKVFISSHEIVKNNYNALSEYGLVFGDSFPLSALASGLAIERMDHYIETDPKGYDYISSNTSRLLNNNMGYGLGIIDFRYIKLKADTGDSYIYETPKEGVLRFHNQEHSSDQHRINDIYTALGIKQGIEETHERRELKRISEECEDLIGETSYEINESVFNIPEVLDLEENSKRNDYTYMVNGVRISRNKVLRICSEFINNNIEIDNEKMLFAISYKSILSDDEVNKLTNHVISNKVGGKTHE